MIINQVVVSGYRIYNFLLKAKFIQYIFEDNFRELLNHIEKYERETALKGDKLKIVSLSRIRTQNYLKKFIKYFHNYAAATYSLEEHYGKFLTSLSRVDIKTEFDTFNNNPFRLFVFAIRNYLTHYSIPSFSISVSQKNIKIKEGSLFLDKGKFNINKLEILSDDQESRPVNGRRNQSSKFLVNDEKRGILCSYIKRNYKGLLNIDIKDFIEIHHREFSNHINNINERLIKINEGEYKKIKYLHKKIVKRQNKKC
jgi:hypothetical protein